MKKSRQEIKFNKYKIKGPDYHYQEINPFNILKFNAYLFARYKIMVNIVSETILQLNEKKKQINILDVGCGDGVLIFLLRRTLKNFNIRFFGTDVVKEALSIALEKNPKNCEFKLASAYKIPYADNSFDIVFSSDVIEHLKYPAKMLKEINRVGQKNAKIIISTPIRYTETPIDHMHFREYFPNELIFLMQKYFQKSKAVLSHKLFYQIMYLKTFKLGRYNITGYRYFLNLINLICGYNPFLEKVNKASEYPSYMLIEATNK